MFNGVKKEDILASIKKITEKKIMLQAERERYQKKVDLLSEEINEDFEKFYKNPAKMDVYGNAYYTVKKIERDIEKCDAILEKLYKKLQKKNKR